VIALLGTAWKFVAGNSILEYLAGVAAIFFIGFALGQHEVTKTAVTQAVNATQTHADAQFAAATGAIAAQVTKANTAVQTAFTVAQKASDTATTSIRFADASAASDRASALAQLPVENARITMEKPNAPVSCPAPVPYTWSGAARQLLDNAAGATGPAPIDPDDRDSTSAAAGGIAPAHSTPVAASTSGR
jgi:hypothetical protein